MACEGDKRGEALEKNVVGVMYQRRRRQAVGRMRKGHVNPSIPRGESFIQRQKDDLDHRRFTGCFCKRAKVSIGQSGFSYDVFAFFAFVLFYSYSMPHGSVSILVPKGTCMNRGNEKWASSVAYASNPLDRHFPFSKSTPQGVQRRPKRRG